MAEVTADHDQSPAESPIDDNLTCFLHKVLVLDQLMSKVLPEVHHALCLPAGEVVDLCD